MIVARTTDRPKSLSDLLGPGLAARLDRLDLLSQRVFAGKLPGERRSKRRGRSVEFDDYRNYVAGDDLRHVDWNVLARLDKFFIKLFREEQDLSLQIVLDASPSMDAGEPGKLVFAARLAMALAYIGLVNQDRVALTTYFGPGVGMRSLVPVRGKPNARRIAAELLEALAPGRGLSGPALASSPLPDSDSPPRPGSRTIPAADFNAALRAVARSRSGTGVTVVLSDFLVREGWRPGLNALFGAGGFDTWCLHILSPGELNPAGERERGFFGDLRLTDAESSDAAEVTVSAAMIKRYRTALDRLCTSLKADCRARGMHYALVPSDTKVDEFVMGALRRGGLLR